MKNLFRLLGTKIRKELYIVMVMKDKGQGGHKVT
jgi:hypothetical protein